MIGSLSTLGSVALALALGLRHGLDADHLAAIDNLTRFKMNKGRTFAPYCGALFAAGHGAAIVLAATALMRLASAWAPPAWFELAGKTLSAAVLLLLGLLNLLSVVTYRRASLPGRLTGVRTILFGFLLRSSQPWQIMLVGVLFAVSFDAVSLAVLFAANATALGGALLATVLAIVFAIGMVAVDTANGLWLSGLAGRFDCASEAASRAMTCSVALISLIMGAAIASSCVWLSLDQWLGTHEFGAGVLIVLLVVLAYLFGKQTYSRGVFEAYKADGAA